MKVLKSFKGSLKWVFFISVILIINFEFVFKFTPELFESGKEVAEIIVKLSYSLISASVFYFIAIHFDNFSSRSKVRPVIVDNLNQLIYQKNILLDEMYFIAITANNGEVQFPQGYKPPISNHYPSKEEVSKLLKNIPTQKTRSNNSNWYIKLDSFCNNLIPHIDVCLLFTKYLNADEVLILAELRSLPIHAKLSEIRAQLNQGITFAEENLSFLESEIDSMLNLYEKIEKMNW